MHQQITRLTSYLYRHIQSMYLRANRVEFESVPIFKGAWPTIINKGEMSLGTGCCFRSFRLRQRIVVNQDATLKIGDNVFVNDGVVICATLSISLGNNVKVGDMTYIYDSDFHEVSSSDQVRQAQVKIGNNVWIAANCMILAGCEIGDHSVVAAGSVVAGRIPPKCLVAGVPARVIKKLEVEDSWVRS